MQNDDAVAQAALDGLGLVASMHAGVYSTDTHGRAILVNPAALRMLGLERHQFVGRTVHDLIHDKRADGTLVPAGSCPLMAVLATGQPARSDDDTFWRGDGTPLPVTWMSAPVVEDAAVTGAVVVFTDVSARHVEAERLAAQHREAVLAQQRLAEANARLSLLGRLTEALATLDADEAARRLARLSLGADVDWAVVDVVEAADSSRMRRVAVAQSDPSRHPGSEHEGGLPALRATSVGPLASAVLAGGQRSVERPARADVPATDPFDAEHEQLLDDLGCAHALITPITSRGHVLGAMTWTRTDPGRPFGDADRALALEIGRRAGVAMENARIHQQQRSAAEALQRSLLTVLPEPDHLEIIGRYLPATEGAEVGGDWYDAFQLTDGATSIVIGDILGHDLTAAAYMGQLRNLLRGISADRLEPPSDVLTRLDSVLATLGVGALATCLLARIEQPPGMEGRGLRQLRWTSAGHLPPAIADADGQVRLLDAAGDLMLGVDPTVPRADHVHPVHPGDTIWLYTDGLVERSDQPLDTGLARLRRTLAALHGLPLGRACDELLTRMLPAGHPDDVAVLAVRAHPEDRPRPG